MEGQRDKKEMAEERERKENKQKGKEWEQEEKECEQQEEVQSLLHLGKSFLTKKV